MELETSVPSAGRSTPVVWLSGPESERTVEAFREAFSSEAVTELAVSSDRRLVALNRDLDDDPLFAAVADCDGYVLDARGDAERWEFGVRFRRADGPSCFRSRCEERGIGIDVRRVYYGTDPPASSEDGAVFSLTRRQREALVLAVERGYYEVPRRCSTADLAEHFGVSAQSVTERLRRGVANLVRGALFDPEKDS